MNSTACLSADMAPELSSIPGAKENNADGQTGYEAIYMFAFCLKTAILAVLNDAPSAASVFKPSLLV